MGFTLYVGNLPFASTDEELPDDFASQGTVISAKVIVDKFTGRSRGFGFIEMSTHDKDEKAINSLNGTELEGRILVVNEARPLQKDSHSNQAHPI